MVSVWDEILKYNAFVTEETFEEFPGAIFKLLDDN